MNTRKRIQRKCESVICPHCDTKCFVSENGRYQCPDCTGVFDVDWFEVPAVSQHKRNRLDYDACGWATTKWLLLSFGALDVSDKKLREELNTDAKRGIRWERTGKLTKGHCQRPFSMRLTSGASPSRTQSD